MIHYNLLKFKPGADIHAAFEKCRSVYAELEVGAGLSCTTRTSERCVTVRDSNADIMMVHAHRFSPDQLVGVSAPIQSTLALAQGIEGFHESLKRA